MLGKPEVWQGTISEARQTRTSDYQMQGTLQARRERAASVRHHVEFKLDGRPVRFTTVNAGASLNDGDQVILGGIVKNGMLQASAYRNLTNGASYSNSSTMIMVLGVLFIVVGIPFCLLLIGFLFVGLGIFLVLLANQQNTIGRLVQQATPMPATPRNAPPEHPTPVTPIVS